MTNVIRRMRSWAEGHPLTAVMLVAAALRLMAVIWSKGFLASDDHFQTVAVCYEWLRSGLFDSSGHLTWLGQEPSRFPLYNLLLYAVMRLAVTVGADDLNSVMYWVRAFHALLSLVGVWAVYRIVAMVTQKRGWAVAAGLAMAAHFALPFLSVRNLIEFAAGLLWIWALLLYYRYRSEARTALLVGFALLSGLAWMFRFQLAGALVLVPVLLWYERRRLQPAFVYMAVLGGMLLLSGLVDWRLMGSFFGSTARHVLLGATGPPTYDTHPLIYLGVILAFLIPPVSTVLLVLAGNRRLWRDHTLLLVSTVAFIVFHSVIKYRQERYVLPMVPALIVIAVLGVYYHCQGGGWLVRKRWLAWVTGGYVVLVNLALLVPLTFNYAHKGLVEPLVMIEKQTLQRPRVLFFNPDRPCWYPLDYGGFEIIERSYLHDWSQLNDLVPDSCNSNRDYFILYPPDPEDRDAYVDSLSTRVGPVTLVAHIGPSAVDWLLHLMNPGHNRTNDAWIYRPGL